MNQPIMEKSHTPAIPVAKSLGGINQPTLYKKPYSCITCDEKFGRHELNHAGEKAYSCINCEKKVFTCMTGQVPLSRKIRGVLFLDSFLVFIQLTQTEKLQST